MKMESHLIGQSINRRDAYAKVTGTAKFPGDFNDPNQLIMKILFSENPHAIIRNVDTKEAEKLDGVVAILTAKDVPCNEYGLMKPDQPVLCGPGSNNKYSDFVKCIGDQIAVVVAENELIAKNACNLINVEYENLPVITNIDEAIKEDAFLIHPELGSNVFSQFVIKNGNVKTGFESVSYTHLTLPTSDLV